MFLRSFLSFLLQLLLVPTPGKMCCRYRLLRPWAASPRGHGSELWWAKPRLPGAGQAVVVKAVAAGRRRREEEEGDDEAAWEAFAREWGVLKYLQVSVPLFDPSTAGCCFGCTRGLTCAHVNTRADRGHDFEATNSVLLADPDPATAASLPLHNLKEDGALDEREALSVGLVGVFERERSLVLAIPAGSRTLREVGGQMHSQRSKKRKKRRNDDEEFFDQVNTTNKFLGNIASNLHSLVSTFLVPIDNHFEARFAVL